VSNQSTNICYSIQKLHPHLTHVTAARRLEGAQNLAAGGKHTKAISLDVSDDAALDRELAKVDLVISLIPYTFHAQVIKGAIRTKKNVVTTSYVSPAMKELDAEAKKAGITVMNEIGLDPVSILLFFLSTRLLTFYDNRVWTTFTPLKPSQRFTTPEAKSSHSCPTAVVFLPPRTRTTLWDTSSPGLAEVCCSPLEMTPSTTRTAPSSA
jgi:hypothetical protein